MGGGEGLTGKNGPEHLADTRGSVSGFFYLLKLPVVPKKFPMSYALKGAL